MPKRRGAAKRADVVADRSPIFWSCNWDSRGTATREGKVVGCDMARVVRITKT